MIFEITMAFTLGILAGIFTGLAPGIHINLVASFLVTSMPRFSFISPLSAVSFIVSMSITHLFIDFIPSIYLGAPEEDTFLSILPGHEMLKQGKAQEAIILTSMGCLLGIIFTIIISPLFIFAIPYIYDKISLVIPFILIFISFYLVFRENNIAPAIITFLLGGFIGLTTFQLSINNPLMPLLTGLFGLSSLIISIKNKTTIPKQKTIKLRDIYLSKKEVIKSIFPISMIAPFCAFLPGIGSGQATVIASEISNPEKKDFLWMQGSASAIFMIISFLALYAMEKTRSGSASAIKSLLYPLNLYHLAIILSTAIIAAIMAFFISLFLSKRFSYWMEKVNYQKLSIVIIIILVALTFLISSWLGLLVLAASTSLGIYTIQSNIKRSNLMSALIVPAIVFYLTF